MRCRCGLSAMMTLSSHIQVVCVVLYVKVAPFVSKDYKKTAPFGAVKTLSQVASLAVLIHVLRHLEVVL
jgi:hypothetical protein